MRISARCLQFVAGLGPRKADGLIKHYKRANTRLETLDQLISDKGIAMRKFGKFLGLIKHKCTGYFP